MLAAPAGHGAHPMGYCNFVSRDEINKMHISLSFFICVFRYTGTPAYFVTFRVKHSDFVSLLFFFSTIPSWRSWRSTQRRPAVFKEIVRSAAICAHTGISFFLILWLLR
jgi:hypothetical protein